MGQPGTPSSSSTPASGTTTTSSSAETSESSSDDTGRRGEAPARIELQAEWLDAIVGPWLGPVADTPSGSAPDKKIAATAIHELHRTGGKYAMVTMCIGGGMGAAGIFERM